VTKRLGQGLGPRRLRPLQPGDLPTQRDLTTGTVEATVVLAPGVEITQEFDKGYVVNEDKLLSRKYDGLHMQFDYRWSDKFNLGGNYTLSRTRQRDVGSPDHEPVLTYPEYLDVAYAPEGDLSPTSATRLWIVGAFTKHHSLTASVMENVNTGTPTALITNGSPRCKTPATTPLTTNTYYFTARDAY
jgi:hypothetical protein